MSEQTSKRKSESGQPKESEATPTTPKVSTRVKKDGPTSPAAPEGTEIKKDMDRLLDEIDDVLEENAEEFVRSYVQRGGE